MAKKILVIEHISEARNKFLEFLKAQGFDTVSSDNAFVGIHKALHESPDLIICNMIMPRLDGSQILTTLRQHSSTATIPVILIGTSANPTPAEYRKAMEFGADYYLSEPFTLDELFRAIAICLEKRASLKHYYAGMQFKQIPESLDADNKDILVSPNSILPSVPKFKEIFDFIEANYDRQINLSEVARKFGYSPTYLTSLVRSMTGKTLYSWIIERRMAEARSLLLKTEKPVNYIATKVGYPDTGHFIRQFRQFYNTTPKMWRNMHRSISC